MPSHKRHRFFIFISIVMFLILAPTTYLIIAQDEATCPLGQGFWKTHPADWPVDELTLGNQVYTQSELLNILNLSPQGDASLIMVHQLIAVKLNIAIGAYTAAIDSVIAQADMLLAQFDGKLPYNTAPASEIGQEMMIAGSTFDVFNQGLLATDCTVTPELTPEPEVTPEATSEPTDDDLTITIVIEGPVQQININIITIYGIDIEIDPDDPILVVLNIGDVVRIEGNVAEAGNTIVIIAVNITIINVEVYVNDDNSQSWRDTGNCNNPPPDWAPANGWRRRCEGKEKEHGKDKDD